MDTTNPNIKDGAEENVRSSMFLPKKMFKFVVWNTVEKRDDRFDIEVSQMGGDSDQKLEQVARAKASNFISSRTCYGGQKIRRLGDPR